jgi:hypothetical protein
MVYQPSALFATAFNVASAAEQGKKVGQFLDEKTTQAKELGSAAELKAQQAKQVALEKSGAAPSVSARLRRVMSDGCECGSVAGGRGRK